MRLPQTKIFYIAMETIEKTKKEAYWMDRDICKQYIW